MPNFPCSECGACCRRAGRVPGFPEPVDSNGHCVHLTDDNRCGIYEDRPDICRIDVMAEQSDMSMDQYYRATKEACNRMQVQDRQDRSFRITDSDLQEAISEITSDK